MRRSLMLAAVVMAVTTLAAQAAEQTFQEKQLDFFRKSAAQSQSNFVNCKNTRQPDDCRAIQNRIMDNARDVVNVLHQWQHASDINDTIPAWGFKIQYYELAVERSKIVRDDWHASFWNTVWTPAKTGLSLADTWAKSEIEVAKAQRDGTCGLWDDVDGCKKDWDEYRLALEKIIPVTQAYNHAREVADKNMVYEKLVEEATLVRDAVVLEARNKFKYFSK